MSENRFIDDLQKYLLVPFLLVAATTLVHIALKMGLDLERQRLIFAVPILISVVFGGGIAGIVATAMSAMAADFFFYEPIYSIGSLLRIDFWRMSTVIFEGLAITLVLQLSLSRLLIRVRSMKVVNPALARVRYTGIDDLGFDLQKVFPRVTAELIRNLFVPLLLVSAVTLTQLFVKFELDLEYQRLIAAIPILLAVVIGGFRSGVITTMLSAITSDLFFFEPLYSIGGLSKIDQTRMAAKFTEGIFIAGFLQVVFDSVFTKATALAAELGPEKVPPRFTGYSNLLKENEASGIRPRLIWKFILEMGDSQFIALLSIIPLTLLDFMKIFENCPVAVNCLSDKAVEFWKYGNAPYFETMACLQAYALLTMSGTCYFMIDRSATVSRDPSTKHRIIAMATAAIPLLFFFIESSNVPDSTSESIAITILFVGTLITLFGFIALGRSFGVVADVRVLKTNGIYRYVRHPIYLGESLMFIGITIFYANWQSLAVCIAVIVLQLIRRKNEEENLKKAFPEYVEYAKKTGLFFPKIKINF